MLMQLLSTARPRESTAPCRLRSRVATQPESTTLRFFQGHAGVCRGITEGAEYRIIVKRALTIQVRRHLFVVKGGKRIAGSAGRRREASSRGGLRTHAHWLEIDISSCYLDDLEGQLRKSVDRGLGTMAELVAEEERLYIPRRRSQIC